MKNFNWLVKLIFYQHKEQKAHFDNNISGIFFRVGYVKQLHANLCTDASQSMMNHFFHQPFATMAKNPRGVVEGKALNLSNYTTSFIHAKGIKAHLEKHGPFIMGLPLRYGVSHSVVVTGCTDDQFVYNDPLTGSHKMMSIQMLENLSQNANQIIEIAVRDMVDPSHLKKEKQDKLPEQPPHIIPKNYQKFFSVDKMENPCDAILQFLEDYSTRSLWCSSRHHKNLVRTFISNHENSTNLETLLSDLNRSLAKTAQETNGELYKRILTIHKIMNRPDQEPEQENNNKNTH